MRPLRDPETLRIAARILLWQGVVTLALAALCALVWGGRHGMSALAGGSIGFIANLFMVLASLRESPSAGMALARLYVGQIVKVALTVAMLFAVARQTWAEWPPLLGAYIATLVVFWMVPALSGPRLPPRSRPPQPK